MTEPKTPEEFVRFTSYKGDWATWTFGDGKWSIVSRASTIRATKETVARLEASHRAASDLAVQQDREKRGREPCSRCGRWLTPLRVWNDPVCVACFDATIINESLIRQTTEDSPDAEGVTQ